MCDFIHVLIFVIVSKCRKSPKLANIVMNVKNVRDVGMDAHYIPTTSIESMLEVTVFLLVGKIVCIWESSNKVSVDLNMSYVGSSDSKIWMFDLLRKYRLNNMVENHQPLRPLPAQKKCHCCVICLKWNSCKFWCVQNNIVAIKVCLVVWVCGEIDAKHFPQVKRSTLFKCAIMYIVGQATRQLRVSHIISMPTVSP